VAYNKLDPEKRQVCWSHLVRDFTFHAEGKAAQKAFGEAGLLITQRLFKAWHHYQHDGDRAALQQAITPLKRELRTLLQHAARTSAKNRYHRTFAKNLLKNLAGALGIHDRPWHRADQQRRRARPPRSSHLPQALLRQPVTTRRTNNRRLLSASQTCRLQHRSLFAYLTDLLTAKTAATHFRS